MIKNKFTRARSAGRIFHNQKLNDMKNAVLEITDTGDPSVGIFARSFEIQCPFSEQEIDKEDADWFKTKMIELYREFCDGGIMAQYDFEPKDRD